MSGVAARVAVAASCSPHGHERSPSPARQGPRVEAGSSPLTMVFAVAVFLAFLLLSTQVLVHLYATSTVTAVAFDTARRVAADGADCSTVGAGDRIVEALGRYGQRIDEPVCASDGDQTVVTISGPTPARLADVLGGGLGMDRIERTARVRTEDFVSTPAGGP